MCPNTSPDILTRLLKHASRGGPKPSDVISSAVYRFEMQTRENGALSLGRDLNIRFAWKSLLDMHSEQIKVCY